MFAGCGSPWKNPCRKIIVIQVSVIRYARRRRSSISHASSGRSASCDPLEELERQHARARVAPVDARDPHVRVAREVVVEGLGVAPLEPVVELLADRARELVDELARVDEVERADALLARAARPGRGARGRPRSGAARSGRCTLTATRRPFGSVARCTWPIDAAASGVGSNSVKSCSIERLEVFADHALDVRVRERPDVVLEAAQLGDDVRRDDVGPRREQLAELDEGRAELVEHLAQVLAALGRRALSGRASAGLRGGGRSGGGSRRSSRSRA